MSWLDRMKGPVGFLEQTGRGAEEPTHPWLWRLDLYWCIGLGNSLAGSWAPLHHAAWARRCLFNSHSGREPSWVCLSL